MSSDALDECTKKLRELNSKCAEIDVTLQRLTRQCEHIVRTGERIGKRCGEPCRLNMDACTAHLPLRIKKYGQYYRIIGTSVLVNILGNVIGVQDIINNTIKCEETPEVITICRKYDLSFHKPEPEWI